MNTENITYIMPFCFNFIKWVRDNLFNYLIEIIVNIAMKVLIPFINAIVNAIYTAVIGVIFSIYVIVLKVLDIFQDIFGYLSGTGKVSYTIDGVSGTGYLTDVLVKMPYIKNAFWAVWFVSVILCGIFLIAAVIRSISHLDDQGRPINEILKSAAKTFVMFVVIQVVMFGTISLSSIVIDNVSKAMNAAVGSETEVRFADALFAVTIVNAIPSDDMGKNAKSLLSELMGGQSLTAEELDKNWETCLEFYRGEKKYYDVSDYTKKDSKIPLVLTKIDYISGILCLVFLIKYLVGAALAFVNRILMVIVSYVTAPFFIALTPIDDGERFQKWKDMFVGNCLSSIGIILSARIFLLVLPMFLANGFIYEGTGILSYIIRVYSVILLCLAFENIGDVFSKILSDTNIMGSSQMFSSAFNAGMEAYNVVNILKKKKK